MNHNEALRLKQAVASMRRSGSIAALIAESKVDSVISGLSKTMKDDWSYAELENEIKELVAMWPSVKLETDEAIAAAQKAARLATPDPKRMTAQERLAFANQKKSDEMKAAADATAKAADPAGNHNFDTLRTMRPAQRLELARTWKSLGVEDASPTGPTPQQIKSDAALRLSAANAAAAAKKKA
jgi:hypothetical protein